MPETGTFVDQLRARAAERPQRRAFTFLGSRGDEEAWLTYAGLNARCQAVAARLRESGLAGERVLLLLPPGLDFVPAFLGCLYACAAAVPTYLPRPGRPDPRLSGILRDAAPKAVLTHSALRSRLEGLRERVPGLGGLPLLAVDEDKDEDGDGPEGFDPPDVRPEDLAFLQYTSGSTGTPRGVRVSHRNLLQNEEMIRRAFGQSESSIVLSWLPPYHDMGLIGGILQPLYAGASCVLMSPLSFLQRPASWLEAMSRYRATTSGGPDFAYGLCARRVRDDERAALDLSHWTVAFNGAEPVRPRTLESFAEAFAPCGFRRSAFFPCYGLAEATLFVAGAGHAEPSIQEFDAAGLERNLALASGPGASGARRLVSCGRADGEQAVVIADPRTCREHAPGQVGEIWVAGPHVTAGYWNRPEENERLFATLPGGGTRFLRTGDLGFLAGGELFITGRLKDLLIIRGRNLYPQDLEATAERSHPDLRPGGGAVFGVDSGEERAVVVHEIDRKAQGDPASLAGAVRRAIAEEHGVQVWDVAIVPYGAVPRTSSGKVRRQECRRLYLAGELPLAAGGRPAGATAGPDVQPPEVPGLAFLSGGERRERVLSYLLERSAQVLRLPVEQLDPESSLMAMGLDSMAATELPHALEADLGVALPLVWLLRGPSLAEVAGRILSGLDAAAGGPAAVAPVRKEAEAPLSHGQAALWFVERLAPESAVYNIAVAARVAGPLWTAALRDALRQLTRRHPALRTRVYVRDGQPVQRVEEDVREDFLEVDAGGEDVQEWLAREALRPFDLGRAPLLRARLLRRSEENSVLLLAVHHIVADFVSLAVLAEELEAFYIEALGGPPGAAPPLPRHYFDAVRSERELVEGVEGERLFEAWREHLQGVPHALESLPTGRGRRAPAS